MYFISLYFVRFRNVSDTIHFFVDNGNTSTKNVKGNCYEGLFLTSTHVLTTYLGLWKVMKKGSTKALVLPFHDLCVLVLRHKVTKSESHQSNMLNLLILHIAFLIMIFSGSYIIYIQNYKSLGMQTLYDYILNNVIIDTIICFSSITFCYTVATFFNNIPPSIAKLILALVMVCTVHNGISLVSVAVIRYLLVFHGTIFYAKEDDKILRVTKIANFTMSMIMALLDSAFIFDFESSGNYQSMVHQNIPTQGGISSSMKISFGFVIIAFSTLQVRLEIQNYKFGEGFFMVLKRWWTDSHQDETNENEEWGVNFQRIMTLMLSICTVLFFTSGVIYFKDYPLFGYVSVVPPSQLIQLIVIDLLWLMIIIQHPIARKKFFHLVKGTNETVQIIRF